MWISWISIIRPSVNTGKEIGQTGVIKFLWVSYFMLDFVDFDINHVDFVDFDN